MSLTVLKFGGTSLADAQCYKQAAEIVMSGESRRYVVVSAPGKRFSDDVKVTDMLLRSSGNPEAGELIAALEARFTDIVTELGIDLDLSSDFASIAAAAQEGRTEFLASRGEYISSKIMAALLGYDWIDAADCVVFNNDGSCDWEATKKAAYARLSCSYRAVIPGFYGRDAEGNIRTFSRGGSDITGAIVAEASQADLYENWTDVSGFMTADPRIIKNPQPIEMMSYRELRELSYMGASVLHEDAVFPAKRSGIPIRMLNTKRPQDPGTLIVPFIPAGKDNGPLITGIAGKKGFATIAIEKDMMSTDASFLPKVLDVLIRNGVTYEHIPSGIDTISVIVAADTVKGRENLLYRELTEAVNPDSIEIKMGPALITVVGRNMAGTIGTLNRVANALTNEGITIRMIDQGADELNIIVGVDETVFETAMTAIYDEFMGTAAGD